MTARVLRWRPRLKAAKDHGGTVLLGILGLPWLVLFAIAWRACK